MVQVAPLLIFCGITAAGGRYAGATYHFDLERGWEAGLISSLAMAAIWVLGALFSPDVDSPAVMFLCSFIVVISGLVGTLAGVWEYCQNNGGNMFPKFLRAASAMGPEPKKRLSTKPRRD